MFTGNDNYGRPKSDYLTRIKQMSDETLGRECYDMIFHAARCANNHRADWHWMVDACWSECKERGSLGTYKKAFSQCVADHT